MSEFNFKSAICTSRVQSERLLSLGLKKETADMAMCYVTHDLSGKEIEPEFVGYTDEPMPCEERQTILFSRQKFIPAWSLHRLWELLPKSIWHDNGLEKKYHPIIEYGFVNYVAECGMELFDFDCGYEVWGSMIVVIEWLIKEGYFPKEYLV